ncbi:MAG TPA: alpha/beta fold hydrolase [Gemmatimonadota bacterium]|nr:alpha/beta fold hydrolase [Gemmatimonadota bacterium]
MKLTKIATAAVLAGLGALPPAGTSPLAAQTALPPATSRFVGRWEGALDVGGTRLRIVFHVRAPRREGDGLTATMDSPDQGAADIPVASVAVSGDSLRLDVAVASAAFMGRLEEGEGTIDGEWRQGGMALPLRVQRLAGEAAAPPRPQEPRPPYPYTEESVEIEVPDGGVRLAGTLTLPDGAGPFPAVVLVSGSGAQDRDETLAGHRPFLVLADHLARRGVAVLRTDDRGVGGSTGSTFDATLADRADDLLAAVRLLRGRPDIDPERVGALGHSEGGWVVPEAAVRAPGDIAFVVLLAGPGQSPSDLLRSQQRAILRAEGAGEARIAAMDAFLGGNLAIIRSLPDTAAARGPLVARRSHLLAELAEPQRRALEAYFAEQTAAEREQALRVADTRWFRDLVAFDPEPWLEEMRQPALALLGGRDLQVPPAANAPLLERLLDAKARPDRDVRVLPGLNHLFQPAGTGLPSEYASIDTTMSAAALDAVSDWILRSLAGPASTRE